MTLQEHNRLQSLERDKRTMLEEKSKSTTEEEVLPQVAILQSIQRNMFSDPALESAGLVILGEAIRRSPELNNPDLFADVTFGAETNNDWEKYEIKTAPIWSGQISKLLPSFDFIVEQVINSLTDTIESYRIVAGTLRMRISETTPLNAVGAITLELLWIQEITDE